MDSTCIGSKQQVQQFYYNNADSDLLLETLKNIWHNYLQTFDNVDLKVTISKYDSNCIII